MQPFGTGPGVMKTKVFDIQYRKFVRLENRSNLTQARNVTARKYTLADPGIGRLRVAAADRVDQSAASRFQTAIDNLAGSSTAFEYKNFRVHGMLLQPCGAKTI